MKNVNIKVEDKVFGNKEFSFNKDLVLKNIKFKYRNLQFNVLFIKIIIILIFNIVFSKIYFIIKYL